MTTRCAEQPNTTNDDAFEWPGWGELAGGLLLVLAIITAALLLEMM